MQRLPDIKENFPVYFSQETQSQMKLITVRPSGIRQAVTDTPEALADFVGEVNGDKQTHTKNKLESTVASLSL